MNHRAIYCGRYAAELINEYKTADVLGVYSAGTYLLFGDSVLLICDASKKSVPFGISVDGYESFRDSINGAEYATVTEDRLTVGDAVIKLCAAEKRTCRIPAPPSKESLDNAIQLLLSKKQEGFAPILGEGEITDPYAKKARELAEELFGALNKGDTEELAKKAALLTGLGKGLTPSGDDLLCGALYALHYCQSTKNEAFLLADAVIKAKKNTNIISRRYLESAAAGEYFGLTAELCGALCREEDIETALDGLLTVGSSSGGDIATGMLLAFLSI